jgi:hypothetical protein
MDIVAFQARHDIIPAPGGENRLPGALALGALRRRLSDFLHEPGQDGVIDVYFHGLLLGFFLFTPESLSQRATSPKSYIIISGDFF